MTCILTHVSVALNYQSDGRMLQINKGRFLANGNCGYVMKPDIMIKGNKTQIDFS